MTRRLLLLGTVLLTALGSAACSPTDNCLLRGTCEERVHIVQVETHTDRYMTRGEAELTGWDRWIEVPASDAMAACEDPDNLDTSAC